jgi:outer membrane protein assembly factor BamB
MVVGCFVWVALVAAAEAPAGAGVPEEAAKSATARVGLDSVGKPWGVVTGTLQFRGNPTRTWYGEGPVPSKPEVLWRFPRNGRGMCADSPIGKRPRHWCGTGWTGQPVVWERPDGITEVIFGAFDKRVHFLNAATGRRTRPDFRARDIIKGSVTLDPDGFPLIYFGARDGRMRAVAIDRETPKELWALRSTGRYRGIWDNDFDSSPVVVDGILYEGAESGYLFAVELNRHYRDGQVQIKPEILLAFPTWDKEMTKRMGDRNAGIESSVTIVEDRLYVGNGHGRVLGLDISRVRSGEAPVVFDFWTGEDTDATVVVDEQGKLYVASELERDNMRSRQVGHLMKLDPDLPDDPLVWSIHIPGIPGDPRGGGIWSTAALGNGVIYATTQSGRLLVVDRNSGEITWEKQYQRHLWASPIVVDETLIVATCKTGRIDAFDISNARVPTPRWTVALGERRCIESTPALWRGRIFVGSWEGYLFAVGDR